MPNVTVTQPSVIKVEVGSKKTAVQSINYGSRTIYGSSDLVINSPQTGYVIAYNAANNNFELISSASSILRIDGGFF